MTKIKTYKITYYQGLNKTIKRQTHYKLIEAPNKKYAEEYLRSIYKYEIEIIEVSEVK